jgi:predicted transcriptional regulator
MIQHVDFIPVVCIDYLTPHQLMVYVYIKSHKYPKKLVRFSINQAAKHLSMSHTTVSNCLEFLIDKGIIIQRYPPRRLKQADGSFIYYPGLYSLGDGEWAKRMTLLAKKECGDLNYRSYISNLKKKYNKKSIKK